MNDRKNILERKNILIVLYPMYKKRYPECTIFGILISKKTIGLLTDPTGAREKLYKLIPLRHPSYT